MSSKLATHSASNIYYIFILFNLPSTGCLVSASDYDSICICTYIVSEARKSRNDVSYVLSGCCKADCMGNPRPGTFGSVVLLQTGLT